LPYQKRLKMRVIRNINKYGRLLVWIGLVVALAFGGAARESAGAEPTLVRIGYGGIAGYQLPLWVVREAGISRKYGIEVEPLLIAGGALNMQALVAGSIQMSQNSASSAIQGAVRGAPIVVIATLENKMPFQIVARAEIKDPQQLKGKRIGILRFGGSNDTIFSRVGWNDCRAPTRKALKTF
jgi:ABC-type nitrate/sulfonate/bicarbonate transport system substrate-binding protein